MDIDFSQVLTWNELERSFQCVIPWTCILAVWSGWPPRINYFKVKLAESVNKATSTTFSVNESKTVCCDLKVPEVIDNRHIRPRWNGCMLPGRIGLSYRISKL